MNYYKRRCTELKYMKAMIETVELKAEDVVLTSGGESCADDEEEICWTDGFDCRFFA